MSNFNKSLLGKNIKFLAAQKGIKVGDLESQVEVSAGYFSRLANDDGKSNSTLLDTICKVSEKLGASVNTLISTDISALTPNETLLSKFFDKLGRDTAESVLIWDLETKEELDNPYYQANHPLFENNNPYGEGYDLYYKSRFDTNVKIAGDGYKVTVKNKWLYLLKVKEQESSGTGFELYFVPKNNDKDEPEPICKAYPESDLYNQVKDLYNAASESSRHVKLSDSVIGTINGYMDIQFQEGIPF